MTHTKMHAAFVDFHRIHQLIEQAAARIVRTLDLPPWLEFEDLVQEGFRMACEAVGRWDPERARFTTYLYLHLAFFLRREIQRQLPSQYEHPLSEEEVEGLEGEEDPLHGVELHYTLSALLGRLREESPRAFEVIVQFYGLEGRRRQSLASIERRLGLRRGEGEQWLKEGLSRLRQLWREEVVLSATEPPRARDSSSPLA
ncbi:sigma factor [Thermoflexus sp.]|uniref:sigma factor n=1 Tax=Thermoflexus sp. TaxID=1969742 RepID=UPI0025E47740|nr:sigma factor [Thermoflexus sp.]MDW8180910.1 sigma factor [Anaerolineae bacterium]MCS6964625.1 hypothetical protein [Thermoflexus sp.]MCS7351453.1 hypothetical protein [Thermoflexus sp.]MCX7691236.1 hypothetical protein [Thermoflexus sp.]MDW8184988.1 sigma factor [Anaerolineae bacterium]